MTTDSVPAHDEPTGTSNRPPNYSEIELPIVPGISPKFSGAGRFQPVPAYNDYLIRRVEKLDSAFNFDEMHEIITALRTQAELSSLLASARAEQAEKDAQIADELLSNAMYFGYTVVHGLVYIYRNGAVKLVTEAIRAAVPLAERNNE